MKEAIKNRYEFSVLVDVTNGNINGDPENGNYPRLNPFNNIGLITDVCLKRKVRDYVETIKEDAEGFRIYIKKGACLNETDGEAWASAVKVDGVANMSTEELKKALKNPTESASMVRDYLTKNYYDVRTFGAVVTKMPKSDLNYGQIRGPVQFSFARSIDPIYPIDTTVSRVAITRKEDADNKTSVFGHKYCVAYGLYRFDGYISANLARKVTGFSEEDLELLWEAILNMFENDRSAARGQACVRKLIVFKHASELGNAPAHELLELVKVHKKDGVETPNSYSDYEVSVDTDHLPEGVTCEIKR